MGLLLFPLGLSVCLSVYPSWLNDWLTHSLACWITKRRTYETERVSRTTKVAGRFRWVNWRNQSGSSDVCVCRLDQIIARLDSKSDSFIFTWETSFKQRYWKMFDWICLHLVMDYVRESVRVFTKLFLYTWPMVGMSTICWLSVSK